MLVGQVAHVCLVNVASDEPAHNSSSHYVRSKVFLRSYSRSTNDPCQAIRGDRNDRLVLELVGHKGCDGPYLNRVSGWKRSPATPKVTGIFLVGPITTRDLLQNSSDYQSVQQRFGSQYADLACLRVVSPHS